MDANAFCNWMKRMNLNSLKTSQALGISPNTITRYRREGTPLYVDLACSALSYGLPPMGEKSNAPSLEEEESHT